MSHLNINGVDKTLDHIYVNTGSIVKEAWEARDKNDHLIWGRADTFTDTSSISARCYGLPVKSWEIDGNSQQSGVPSPQSIIMPDFCGKLVGTDWTIPITCAGQTTPVYLGEVPTVRRVKKLVLDGTEDMNMHPNCAGLFRINFTGYFKQPYAVTCICSHYPAAENVTNYTNVPAGSVCFYAGITATSNVLYVFDSRFTTLDDFKLYLTAQYSTGNPVTVWYVLAEPTTAIVNEPLAKIGTYADTLTSDQAGVTIPTTNESQFITASKQISLYQTRLTQSSILMML